jgi:hypothetical protein
VAAHHGRRDKLRLNRAWFVGGWFH